MYRFWVFLGVKSKDEEKGNGDMKLIHCADLHLDSKMESNLNKDQATLRRGELLESFERMVDYAQNEAVDAILIAGDMFDKTHIRKEAKKRVMTAISTHENIEFYYIRGNHDRCDFIVDGVDEVPQNLHLFSEEGWTSYSFKDVVITGMELSPANVSTMATKLVLNQTDCNIVMLHGQRSDYDGKDGAEIINTTSLKGKYIDYLALGHIHSFEQGPIDDRGVYCYSGCLEGRGFDETGDKGFVMLTVEDGKIESEFIPFAYRRLHEIEVKQTSDMETLAILDACREACDDVDPQDLVKFVITGQREVDDSVDVDRIVRTFESKYFFVKCYDKTKKMVDYDSFAYDKSLKGEFVRLMKDQDMDEDMKSAIVELGIKAIMGEDI